MGKMFSGHCTPRRVARSKPRLITGGTELGNRDLSLQDGNRLVVVSDYYKAPTPRRRLGQTSRRPSSREEGHQVCAGLTPATQDR